MTNAELVALLREARGHVFNWPDYTVNQKRSLLDRIDAALAAHDAVPPSEEEVEWRRGIVPSEYNAKVGRCDLTVFSGALGATWLLDACGTAPTVDEAKSAAIAAARGMR